MKLNSLHITNFRVIKSARLDLEDAVIGIVGPNGAGKSTLVEAVAWALYGNPAARSGKSEIKTQTAGTGQDCKVEMVFESRGEKYRLIRRLVGKSERAEVELYRGNSSESVGIRETQGYIGQLLGLDFEGFQTSFLARQQELNALSDLQPARRRAQLAGMLGIDRLDKVIARIKEDNRGYSGQAEYISRRLIPEDQIKAEVKTHQERLALLAGKKDKLGQQVAGLEGQYKESAEDLSGAQALKDRYTQAQGELRSIRQSCDYLSDQKKSLAEEIGRLEGLKVRRMELAEQVRPLNGLQKRIQELDQARSRRQLRLTLEGQKQKADRESKGTAEETLRVEKRLAAAMREIEGIPQDIEAQVVVAAEGINRAREQYGRRRAEAERLSKDIALLKEQLANIDRFGPDSVCDRCLRPLGEDLPRMKAHLADEIKQLERERKAAEAGLEEDKKAGLTLSEQEKKLRGLLQRFQELTQSQKNDSNELQRLSRLTADLDKQQGELAERLAEIPEQAFDETEYQTLLKQQEVLNKAQSELDRLTGQTERLPAVQESLAQLAEKIKRAGQELATAEAKVAELDFSPERFLRVTETHNKLQNELMAARESAATAGHEYKLGERDLAILLEKLDTQTREREEMQESRIKLHHGEKLANLMAAYKQHLVASIRPALAELAGSLVGEMTNGRYGLVELDEDYNLRIMDSGEFFGIERFSGGEKDLANLCLRLAISQSLTESANLDRSFIILDEVFGSQDVERRELIVDALTGLKHRFPQIILITHVDELKQRVEQLIEVEPTGRGYSEVKVNGALV